jgi:hypothetical protein
VGHAPGEGIRKAAWKLSEPDLRWAHTHTLARPRIHTHTQPHTHTHTLTPGSRNSPRIAGFIDYGLRDLTSGSVEVCNAVVASAYESGAVRLDVWVRVCESANACVCAYACAHASVCVRLPFFVVAQKLFSLQTVKLTDPYWKGMNDGGLLYPCVRARCGASGCDCAHT